MNESPKGPDVHIGIKCVEVLFVPQSPASPFDRHTHKISGCETLKLQHVSQNHYLSDLVKHAVKLIYTLNFFGPGKV